MIYLDNAATTPLSPKVLEAMLPYLKEEYGNAGSIYSLGRRAADAIAKARRQVADFIGADPSQIIFTSGGTEANNLAILGVKSYLKKIDRTHIITSPVEHDSVLKAVRALCGDKMNIKDEFYTSYLGVDKYGHVSYKDLYPLVTSKTGLVSIMCVNNEVGVLNPIKIIGHICKQYNILFHTDCVQAAGTHIISVDEFSCDFLSISSHKIHGPKGVGALYVRDKEYISPLINGGGAQEFGLRGGTENVAGIVGFGEACELAAQNIEQNAKTIIDYKKGFCESLKNCLSEYGIENSTRINGLLPGYPGKTLNITFDGVDAETLVLMLDANGVCVSAGSACQSHESTPSHVLTAIGLTDEQARSSIRISFSEMNKPDEVDRAAKILASCIKTLREVSA